jgi:NAD(P)-dependent dehydrogenase (short-subunit alcohol dehydrogenase family)
MNKIALVTGGNRGIGFEICRQLAKRDFSVILTSRSEEQGKEAVRMLSKENLAANFLQLDVSSIESVKRAVQELNKEKTIVDVLINNAAIIGNEHSDILHTSENQVYDVFGTNVFGPLHMSREFRPLLKTGSRIINISSSAGQICQGMGSYAPLYSASKASLNAVTCQLAHAFARDQISVNAMCPGWVRSDMGGRSAPRSLEQGADTAVWLATEASQSITGKFFKDRKEISW